MIPKKDDIVDLLTGRQYTRKELARVANEFDTWLKDPQRKQGGNFVLEVTLANTDPASKQTIVTAFAEAGWTGVDIRNVSGKWQLTGIGFPGPEKLS